jgi:phage tail sheath protein FI
VVVWGARTLDGNSNDFRYVQVRRTLIYVEQSIKAAIQPFVFAANDAGTWISVTSMISNFLTNLWQAGGLMGSKPNEAFSVSCGLGSTMSAQDVLNGYMIVAVSLSLIRPAEFIELTFTQTMQGS